MSGAAMVVSSQSSGSTRVQVRQRTSPSPGSGRKRPATDDAAVETAEPEESANTLRAELKQAMEFMQARESWWMRGVKNLETSVHGRFQARDELIAQAEETGRLGTEKCR